MTIKQIFAPFFLLCFVFTLSGCSQDNPVPDVIDSLVGDYEASCEAFYNDPVSTFENTYTISNEGGRKTLRLSHWIVDTETDWYLRWQSGRDRASEDIVFQNTRFDDREDVFLTFPANTDSLYIDFYSSEEGDRLAYCSCEKI